MYFCFTLFELWSNYYDILKKQMFFFLIKFKKSTKFITPKKMSQNAVFKGFKIFLLYVYVYLVLNEHFFHSCYTDWCPGNNNNALHDNKLFRIHLWFMHIISTCMKKHAIHIWTFSNDLDVDKVKQIETILTH